MAGFSLRRGVSDLEAVASSGLGCWGFRFRVWVLGLYRFRALGFSILGV